MATEALSSAPPGDTHVLALHELRQRQVRTAFLHGRSRNWRDRQRIWPAALTAVVIIALLIVTTCVLDAFHQQQLLDAGRVVGGQAVMREPLPSS